MNQKNILPYDDLAYLVDTIFLMERLGVCQVVAAAQRFTDRKSAENETVITA